MAKKEAKKEEAPPVDGEGAEGAEGEGKPKKKGLPIMLIAIAGAAVLVLGGGGAGAYFLFLAPKHPPAAEAGKDAKKPEKKEKKKDEKKEGGDKPDPKTQPVIADGPNGVTYFTTPELLANIQSADGHSAYLKLQLTFECSDDETVDLLQSSMPRVNDVLQGFINELRPEDLTGGAGDILLKQEILRRINLILAPHKIDSVLIVQKITT